MNIEKIRKAVESLQVQQSTVGNDRVLLDEVLAILDGQPEYWRPDEDAMEYLVPDERKGQRRVVRRRGYDVYPGSEQIDHNDGTAPIYGRRSHAERRRHE